LKILCEQYLGLINRLLIINPAEVQPQELRAGMITAAATVVALQKDGSEEQNA